MDEVKVEKKKPMGPPPMPKHTGIDWPGEAPVVDESEITAAYSADVVVIGGGNAGLATALGAAEHGASVIVIERRSAEKMTWMGEQIGTFNSEFLTKQGFGGYDLDEIVDEYCRVYNGFVNRELVKKYVYNSGAALDHYLSFVPADSTLLNPDQCNVHQAVAGTKYPIVRGGVKTWAGTLQFRGDLVTTHGIRYRVNQFSRLPELMNYVKDETVRLGVDWRFGHSSVVLTKEGDRVTGVIAKNPEGKYVKFEAKKGVVIALGNFTKQGFKMGIWAGGHMDNCPFEPYPALMMFNPAHCFGIANFMFLNNNGKRFYNEAEPFSNAISRQPDGIVSYVTDANWVKQVETSSLLHGAADFGMPAYFEQAQEDLDRALEAGAEGYDMRNLGLTERETNHVYAANTLDELADYLGYKGEAKANFLASIERYNELCRKGKDEDWGKDAECMLPIEKAPFYGGFDILNKRDYQLNLNATGDMSGLATDDNLQLVDNTCNPIPGLYAAGDGVGYYRSIFYYTPCGGNHIGTAITHGQLLGKMLAEL